MSVLTSQGKIALSLANAGQVTLEWSPAGVTRLAEVATIAGVPLEFLDSSSQLAIQPPGFAAETEIDAKGRPKFE